MSKENPIKIYEERIVCKERIEYMTFLEREHGGFYLKTTHRVMYSDFGTELEIGFKSIVMQDIKDKIPVEMLYTNIKSINYNEGTKKIIIKGVTNQILCNTVECVCTKVAYDIIKNHIIICQEEERSKLIAEKGEEAINVKYPIFTYGVGALGLIFLCLFAFLAFDQKSSTIPLIPTIILLIASIVLLILNSDPKWYKPCKYYLVLYVSLILVSLFIWGDPGPSSSNKSEWEKLDDSQKDWYIRNYGGGKSKAYDDAINSYRK